jgi:ParB-like nuclease family protein
VSTVKSTYKFHKYADLYPLASGEELSRLTEDIKKNGLANPIVITFSDGCERIVDGRNRSIACERAGVEPQFIQWQYARDPLKGCYDQKHKPYGRNEESWGTNDEFEDELLMWVVAQNSHRRHLSQDQLKMVVAKVADSFKEIANQRKLAALKKGDARPDPVTATVAATGTAIQQAIKATGFTGSERSVADAVKVQKESPELAAKVSAGEMTVNAAKNLLPKAEPNLSPKQAKGEQTAAAMRIVSGAEPELWDLDEYIKATRRWAKYGIESSPLEPSENVKIVFELHPTIATKLVEYYIDSIWDGQSL